MWLILECCVLFSDKQTILSPVVLCGPTDLLLQKPVVLSIQHCASMRQGGWKLSVCSSRTPLDEPPHWQVVRTVLFMNQVLKTYLHTCYCLRAMKYTDFRFLYIFIDTHFEEDHSIDDMMVVRWAEWGFFHDYNFTLKYHIRNSSAFCFDMQPCRKFYQLTFEGKNGLKVKFWIEAT